MYRYIYEAPVTLTIPKSKMDADFAHAMLAEDAGDCWRLRHDVKIGCDQMTVPTAATIRAAAKRDYPSAKKVDIWSGFFWGR